MNWNVVAGVAETVASLAVVISLIYLAIQVRLQVKESQLSVVNSLTQQWGEAVQAFATDADLYEIWMKGLERFDTLPPIERGRFSAILVNLSQIFESVHLHYREGRVDPDLWLGFENRMQDVFATPGVQSWWKLRRHWHARAFQDYIDSAIARSAECDGRYVAVYGQK